LADSKAGVGKGRKETGDGRQEKAKDFRRDEQFWCLQHNGRFYHEIILQPVYPFVIAKKNVHQLAEAVNSLIFHIVWSTLAVNFVEEFPGAFDLCFFDLTELHGHGAFGFSHKVNMFNYTFFEGYLE